MRTALAKGFGGILPLAASLLAVASVSCGKASNAYTPIDDMETDLDTVEDHLARIKWSAPGKTPGFWSTSTDCSQLDRILPEPFSVNPRGWSYSPVPTHETRPGVTSTHAARLMTNPNKPPLVGIWGANMGFDFAEQTLMDGSSPWPPPACVDAGTLDEPFKASVDLTDYSGLTFWAMAEASGRQAIRVQVNDVSTDPRGGHCALGDPDNNCYNGFGIDLMLTNTFTQYSIYFSQLQQQPEWGHRSKLELREIYGLNFQVNAPSCATDPNASCAGDPAPVSFVIWIDDVYYINRQ